MSANNEGIMKIKPGAAKRAEKNQFHSQTVVAYK